MHINDYTEDAVNIVHITGRLDATCSDALETFLLTMLKKSRTIVIDCHDVDYLSSAGMRVFLIAQKTAGKEGGKLVFAAFQKPVLTIVQHAGMNHYFTICDTLKEAKDISKI